ncbi:GNAT family N-acetyltransferase [uncultured Methanobrevibacter sp.]|uniref:GNAT family N-acetyltransferase n=1 Tax=uncultured Methanobrevibacter sp. TaxID=253161 RepID=UPI0025F6E163|nr:GNAT family N-acetyltransferase [uncultured Methanobrevibacter sp.]MCI6993659.1 GNAT family N-acetyltransferase [Methanobrevibacter sp.]
MSELTFKIAERKDSGLILEYIKKLADYEKRLDEVIATEDAIEKWVFDEKQAEVIFALVDGTPVGFALYFLSFSTYIGNVNMHLEDLFVDPEHRGKGYGKALLKELGKIVIDRKYGRFEWTCLSWNKPSIDFYLSIGAEKKDWNIFHFTGDALKDFVNE